MHLFLKLFILAKRSTCFRWYIRPSSGAQNCTYGNRHMSNSCCYRSKHVERSARMNHLRNSCIFLVVLQEQIFI